MDNINNENANEQIVELITQACFACQNSKSKLFHLLSRYCKKYFTINSNPEQILQIIVKILDSI